MTEDVERFLCITWEMKNMQRVSGLAWIDLARRQVAIGQFLDSKQYTELETALLQNYTESTCVIMQHGSNYEAQKVKQVLTRCNIVAYEEKPGLSNNFYPIIK